MIYEQNDKFKLPSIETEELLGNSSVQFSGSVMSDSLRPHGLQRTRLLCPSPTPGAYIPTPVYIHFTEET